MAERIGGFSSACYDEVAPFFDLDPALKGTDIPTFDLTPVYIPMPLFQRVLTSIEFFHNQYGLLHDVFNESGVSHFISSVSQHPLFMLLNRIDIGSAIGRVRRRPSE